MLIKLSTRVASAHSLFLGLALGVVVPVSTFVKERTALSQLLPRQINRLDAYSKWVTRDVSSENSLCPE